MFVVSRLVGLVATLAALRSRCYRQLTEPFDGEQAGRATAALGAGRA